MEENTVEKTFIEIDNMNSKKDDIVLQDEKNEKDDNDQKEQDKQEKSSQSSNDEKEAYKVSENESYKITEEKLINKDNEEKSHDDSHTFEEIPYDHTYDDKGRCDIEICEDKFEDIQDFIQDFTNNTTTDNKFIPIEKENELSIQENTNFMKWWPEMALQIIDAMYSTKEQKRNTIMYMMSLFDKKYVNVEPTVLSDSTALEIHNLFKEKIVLYKQYGTTLKNVWCDALRISNVKCKQLYSEMNLQIFRIQEKAQKMYKQTQNIPRSKAIIHDEFRKIVNLVHKDYTYKVQFEKKVIIQEVPDITEKLNQINDMIKRKMKNIPSYTFKSIQNNYTIEIDNVEYDITLMIQSECENYWLEALK